MEELCKDIWLRIQEIMPPIVRKGTPLEHDWDSLPDNDPMKQAVRAEMPGVYAGFVSNVALNTIQLMLMVAASARKEED